MGALAERRLAPGVWLHQARCRHLCGPARVSVFAPHPIAARPWPRCSHRARCPVSAPQTRMSTAKCDSAVPQVSNLVLASNLSLFPILLFLIRSILELTWSFRSFYCGNLGHGQMKQKSIVTPLNQLPTPASTFSSILIILFHLCFYLLPAFH